MEIIFVRPIYLWLLLGLVLLILIHFYSARYARKKALKFANFEAIARVTGIPLLKSNISLLILRLITLLFIILALSGTILWYSGKVSDFNFVLALDASSSMLSNDFSPNRLEAAKLEAINFIDSIGGMVKMGVLSFSGTTFVEQELTTDKYKVKEAIKNLQIKTIGGTNLGGAIINAGNLLLIEDKPRVIILLTDGQSNVGVELGDAIAYANKNHITIHTIGVATEEGGSFGGLDVVSRLDEESLRLIALNTEGNYYRAKDKASLAEAYKEISALSQQRISIDLSPILILFAMFLLFVEWISVVVGVIP